MADAPVMLEGIRVTLSGPVNRTMTFPGTSGTSFSLTLADVSPGTYSVVVAGLLGGRVAHYGETSTVAVTAGRSSTASVALSPFQPIVAAVADTARVLHFNVSYSAVPHATSYVVEWSTSPAMSEANSLTVTETSAEIEVPDEGQYYFAVRAVNAAVTVDGLPSPVRPIYVMQTVSSVAVLPLSPSIVDGTTQQFTAQVRDQDNALIANPTVYWTSSNTLVATTSQTGLVTTVGPGQTTIVAISKGTPGSATLTVTPQAPTRLAFTAQPTNTAAGGTISAIKVAIQNPKGETATSDNTTQITLAIAANPGSGALSGTATATVANGVATFNSLNINKAGSGYTLQATSGSLASVTSSAFSITPGAATQLAFVVPPSSTTAGVAMSPALQVEIHDALGNRVSTARDPVTLAFVANPGSGTLSGATVVNAVDGIASFPGVSIDKAANGYTIRATSGSLTNVTSAAFNIAAAAPAVLVFTTQPVGTATDQLIPTQVTVRDQFGNLVSTAPSVTMSIGANPGAGTLAGTTTQPVVSGVASFPDLQINKVGTAYTLVARSGSITSAPSTAFSMSAGAPAKLAFETQPVEAEPQGPMNTVRVVVLDANDNQTAAVQDVNLTLIGNGGPGVLGGTLTVQTSNGMASFPDLTLDIAGMGYRLNATSAAVTDATSDPFDIVLEFEQVSAGDLNTCGLTRAGSTYCWGYRGVGGTGEGTDSPAIGVSAPVRVVGGHTFLTVSVGYAHACGIRADDLSAYCWGWGSSGQLGNGATGFTNPTPVAVQGGQQFVAISAGARHTCAIDIAGAAFCWGLQTHGRLGNNATIAAMISTPTAVQGGLSFVSISAGYEHTCGIIQSDLTARCWGRGLNGRLGNSNLTDVPLGTPQPVQGGQAFTSISAGHHTCALDTSNTAWCWGANANGQLGVGAADFTDRAVPTAVANSLTFSGVDAGMFQSCGVSTAGIGFCWGLADDGRLGNGEVSGNRETPRVVLSPLPFRTIDAGTPGDDANGNHSCGMTSNGVYCWGANSFGYNGDGSLLRSGIPVKVKGQR